MAARIGSAVWTGGLQDGHGRVVVGPQRWEAGYSFRSRFTDDAEHSTNPEELLATAHAGCFSMALTHVLTQAGSVPRTVATTARVRLRPVDGVPTIDLVELDTTVDVDQWTPTPSRNTPSRQKLGARSPAPWRGWRRSG